MQQQVIDNPRTTMEFRGKPISTYWIEDNTDIRKSRRLPAWRAMDFSGAYKASPPALWLDTGGMKEPARVVTGRAYMDETRPVDTMRAFTYLTLHGVYQTCLHGPVEWRPDFCAFFDRALASYQHRDPHAVDMRPFSNVGAATFGAPFSGLTAQMEPSPDIPPWLFTLPRLTKFSLDGREYLFATYFAGDTLARLLPCWLVADVAGVFSYPSFPNKWKEIAGDSIFETVHWVKQPDLGRTTELPTQPNAVRFLLKEALDRLESASSIAVVKGKFSFLAEHFAKSLPQQEAPPIKEPEKNQIPEEVISLSSEESIPEADLSPSEESSKPDPPQRGEMNLNATMYWVAKTHKDNPRPMFSLFHICKAQGPKGISRFPTFLKWATKYITSSHNYGETPSAIGPQQKGLKFIGADGLEFLQKQDSGWVSILEPYVTALVDKETDPNVVLPAPPAPVPDTTRRMEEPPPVVAAETPATPRPLEPKQQMADCLPKETAMELKQENGTIMISLRADVVAALLQGDQSALSGLGKDVTQQVAMMLVKGGTTAEQARILGGLLLAANKSS